MSKARFRFRNKNRKVPSELKKKFGVKKRDKEFEMKMKWCIFQLQLGMKRLDARKQQIKDAGKFIKLLRNGSKNNGYKLNKMKEWFGDDLNNEMKKYPMPKNKQEREKVLRMKMNEIDSKKFINEEMIKKFEKEKSDKKVDQLLSGEKKKKKKGRNDVKEKKRDEMVESFQKNYKFKMKKVRKEINNEDFYFNFADTCLNDIKNDQNKEIIIDDYHNIGKKEKIEKEQIKDKDKDKENDEEERLVIKEKQPLKNDDRSDDNQQIIKEKKIKKGNSDIDKEIGKEKIKESEETSVIIEDKKVEDGIEETSEIIEDKKVADEIDIIKKSTHVIKEDLLVNEKEEIGDIKKEVDENKIDKEIKNSKESDKKNCEVETEIITNKKETKFDKKEKRYEDLIVRFIFRCLDRPIHSTFVTKCATYKNKESFVCDIFWKLNKQGYGKTEKWIKYDESSLFFYKNEKLNKKSKEFDDKLLSKLCNEYNMDKSDISDGFRVDTIGSQFKQTINLGNWSIGEHESFLRGVEECGRANYRIIAVNYVKTRITQQVVDYSERYFAAEETNTLIKETMDPMPSQIESKLKEKTNENNENKKSNQRIVKEYENNRELKEQIILKSSENVDLPEKMNVDSKAMKVIINEDSAKIIPRKTLLLGKKFTDKEVFLTGDFCKEDFDKLNNDLFPNIEALSLIYVNQTTFKEETSRQKFLCAVKLLPLKRLSLEKQFFVDEHLKLISQDVKVLDLSGTAILGYGVEKLKENKVVIIGLEEKNDERDNSSSKKTGDNNNNNSIRRDFILKRIEEVNKIIFEKSKELRELTDELKTLF